MPCVQLRFDEFLGDGFSFIVAALSARCPMLHPHSKSHQRSSEHMRLAVKLVPVCCPCSQKCHRLLDRHGDASEPSRRPGRQPSDSKFDLTIGELAPIFDNGGIATGWTFVDELAGLNPSLLQRQSEIFSKIARPIRDTVRSSHCVNSQMFGVRRNERLL